METQWYYMQDDEQCGPLSSKQLIALVQTGELTPAHMIWKEGLSGWIPAGSISGLFKEQQESAEAVVVSDNVPFPVVDTDPSAPVPRRTP